jgi:hypothetical protein
LEVQKKQGFGARFGTGKTKTIKCTLIYKTVGECLNSMKKSNRNCVWFYVKKLIKWSKQFLEVKLEILKFEYQ